MKSTKLIQLDELRQKENHNEVFLKVLDEAIQVFECIWWEELDNAQNDSVLGN